jgi:hypothetical protein
VSLTIWLPFANTKANLNVLKDEHVADVVAQGLECLRSICLARLHWRHARMWAVNPAALLLYVARAEREMVRRGYPAEPKVRSAHVALSRQGYSLAPVPPWWYGDPAFHEVQRSLLIQADPFFYTRRMPFTTRLDLAMVWPNERRLREV